MLAAHHAHGQRHGSFRRTGTQLGATVGCASVRDDARRSEAGSGRTDEFSVVCRSPLRVCPQQGEMRPEQAAEKGVVR